MKKKSIFSVKVCKFPITRIF